MKHLILYFLVIAMLASCGLLPFPVQENIDYTFSEEKKPEIRDNAKIYFKNQSTNLKDSFLLDVWTYSKVNDNISYDLATYYYTLLNMNPKYTHIEIFFTNIDYNEAIIYEKNNETAKVGYKKKNTITNYALNGKTYSSVDVLSNSNSNDSDFIPNTVYFSCKYGILRYEYLDGRVYELVGK